MQIWVDADACPGAIKELLFRAAERRKIKVTLVANQSMRIPRSEYIDTILVPSGMPSATPDRSMLPKLFSMAKNIIMGDVLIESVMGIRIEFC